MFAKKSLRKVLFALYVLVVLVMAAATVVEALCGTAFTGRHFYGSWWFVLLWGCLTAAGIAWYVGRGPRRIAVVLLHAAFVVILVGALCTRIGAVRGVVHLRLGQPATHFTVQRSDGREEMRDLPFSLTLTSFRIVRHAGTSSVADYVSTFSLDDGLRVVDGRVSMNHIFTHRGIRLYQISYDSDEQGAYLLLNSDVWGIGLTYTGYGLLFIALIWMMVDPRGGFRRLLKSESLKRGMLSLALAATVSVGAAMEERPRALPREAADAFGQLYVHYNGRICPLQTLAIDFTKKLYGKRSYSGYSAEQVLTGFLLWPEDWCKQPVLTPKGSRLRGHLGLQAHTSVEAFFSQASGGYRLRELVQEYYQGQHDKLHQQAADMDARLDLIFNVGRGQLFALFPYTTAREGVWETTWYAPTDTLPEGMEPDRRGYIRSILGMLREKANAGDEASVNEIIRLLGAYQVRYGDESVPTQLRTRAELAYNAVPFATVLFMVDLTVGVMLLALIIIRIGRTSEGNDSVRTPRWEAYARVAGWCVLVGSFLALSVCLSLRWIVRGTVPMSNGYETMLLTAWLLQLLTLLVCWRLRIVLAFGLLLSGFFLLVSHISQMDPQITHIMPVLSSPLLTVHVSLVMMAYALLSMTFICALTALLLSRGTAPARLRDLSLLALYPALAFLGMGVFIGAIWANVSWGTYWSWDPKETWALITLMVYAVAVHQQTLPLLRRPLAFHAFMALAFLTLLMTYFGVNYVLGGMHSYA